MLEYEDIGLEGKNVVVVRASNIVGKPMALIARCNGVDLPPRDLAQVTLLSDVLVVAAGHPNLVVPQMVRIGAVVIDVGINRLPRGGLSKTSISKASGKRLRM